MRMSSIMRRRSGLMNWVGSVMVLLLVSDEADCLNAQHKKQITACLTTSDRGSKPHYRASGLVHWPTTAVRLAL